MPVYMIDRILYVDFNVKVANIKIIENNIAKQYKSWCVYRVSMSLTVLIIDKTGSVTEQTIKKFDEAELYKKAGLKSSAGFKMYTEWVVPELNGKPYHICLYGKADGRANSENKYEFPPPVDTVLFFGSCILLAKGANDAYVNLTETEWNSIYDHLHGGFDDIGDEDDDEEEDDEDDDLPRTKSGYVKDDFVVDDDEEDEEDDDEEEEEEEDEDEEEEEEVKPKSKRKPAKKAAKAKPAKPTKQVKPAKKNQKPQTVFVTMEQPQNFLECTGELSEEEYI